MLTKRVPQRLEQSSGLFHKARTAERLSVAPHSTASHCCYSSAAGFSRFGPPVVTVTMAGRSTFAPIL